MEMNIAAFRNLFHGDKSKAQSHADSRDLINGVLQHVCRKELIIGSSHNSARDECWLVITLRVFCRISPALPPSQFIFVINSAKRSSAACSPFEVVRNPQKIPDYTVRTSTDRHDANIVIVASFRSCWGPVLVKSMSMHGARTQTHPATSLSDSSELVYRCRVILCPSPDLRGAL